MRKTNEPDWEEVSMSEELERKIEELRERIDGLAGDVVQLRGGLDAANKITVILSYHVNSDVPERLVEALPELWKLNLQRHLEQIEDISPELAAKIDRRKLEDQL